MSLDHKLYTPATEGMNFQGLYCLFFFFFNSFISVPFKSRMTFPICLFFFHIVLTPVIKWSAAKTPGVAWLKAGMVQFLSVKVKNEDLISLAPIKLS